MNFRLWLSLASRNVSLQEDEEGHPGIFMMGLTPQCSFDQPFNGKSAFQMTVHLKMRSWVCVFAFSKSAFSFNF